MVKVSLFLAIIICLAANIRLSITIRNTITNSLDDDAVVYQLLDGCTRFSFDLLKALNTNITTTEESAKDLFFSPYSIWSALIVTYMGARGSTKQEMRNVLGIGDISKAETWRAFKNIRHCSPLSEPVDSSFNSASRIYFQKGITLKKFIQKALNKNVAFVDFKNQADEARKIINTWVERYTHEKIKELIPPNSIGKMTKMVIANAVYFREEWLQPFEPQNTSRRKFTTSSMKMVFVKMMSTKGMFLYGKSKEHRCSILEIPYSDNSMSMIILLPDDRYRGVDDLVNNLTPDVLRTLQESMLPRNVLVSIPKFKVEDTYEMSSVLQDIGLKTLFDKKRVNLSGFTGRREFTLDSVRHKTFIDVNEIGTEAAASTDIFYLRSAVPKGQVVFIADHPFIYFIQDNESNTILFLGTIKEPQEFLSG